MPTVFLIKGCSLGAKAGILLQIIVLKLTLFALKEVQNQLVDLFVTLKKMVRTLSKLKLNTVVIIVAATKSKT